MRVLVFGASGYVGSHLVPRLLAAGYSVRASARRRDVLEDREWEAVDVVEADALRIESLARALAGIDVAFYLVHSMGSGRDFAKLDRLAARNFRDTAARLGVKRIIYLGGLQPAGEASLHLRSRAEVGQILSDGPVPVTELRAGLVVGAGSAAFEVIRDLVNHLPVMTTPRWVSSRSQPIALRDLLSYLVGLLDCPESSGKTFDAGGPEVLTYAEMIRQFGQVVGKRRLIIPLPVLTPRLSSYWLDLVTSVPASVARPLIDGLRHDLLAYDAPLRALLPVPLSGYRAAVAQALADERDAPLPARWAEGALAFRGYDPSNAFYSKGTQTVTEANVPAPALWSVVSRLGGRQGYYYADALWTVRGLMDRLVGGVGMRRGRRHPSNIRVGDAIDFWRVVALEPNHRITLIAEMKLPGSAVLELEIRPEGDERCSLITTARFHPAGIFGLLYWYALTPAHGPIFRGMPRAMVRRAEAERIIPIPPAAAAT